MLGYRGRLRRRHQPLPKFGQVGAMREKELGRRPCRVHVAGHLGVAWGQFGSNQERTKCTPNLSQNLSLERSQRGPREVLGDGCVREHRMLEGDGHLLGRFHCLAQLQRGRIPRGASRGLESMWRAILGSLGGNLGQTKNGPNVPQICPKIRPRRGPRGVPERSWGGSGGFPEPSWFGVLSWSPLGPPLGAILGPSWGFLGPSWALLGPS